MDSTSLNHAIIVASSVYHKALFCYKNLHHDIDIKIISSNELIESLSFTYLKDPIPLLMKKHNISFNNAKEISKALHFNQKGELKIYYETIKDLILLNELGHIEFLNRPIYLFEMNEDISLHRFLKNKNILYKDLNIEDLDIEINNPTKQPITLFPNKYIQYFYIFSDIYTKINQNLLDPNKIKIIIENESDEYYLNIFSNLFDLPLFYKHNELLLSNSEVTYILKKIYKSKSFSLDESNNEYVVILKNIIEKYELNNEESDFEKRYAILLDVLSSYSNEIQANNKGIVITKSFVLDKEYKTYVTNFKHGVFYKEYNDKSYFKDEELLSLDLNPSYIKTMLDKRDKLNFLKYNDLEIISRVKQHLSEAIYDSNFITELNWSKILEINELEPSFLLTTKASKVYESYLVEKKGYSNTSQEYKSYDHSFKKINPIIKDEITWSITNLETYISCPFKYLLSKYIKKSDDDFHARWRGQLIHAVLEDIYHDDYDFEKAFEKGKNKYFAAVQKEGLEITGKEKSYIEIMHHWLTLMIPSFQRSIKNGQIIYDTKKQDSEIPINFEIKEKENIYKFKGIIDKIIWTQGEDKDYYSIIDYKTGDVTFNAKEVFLGKSPQLPLYYYAIESQEDKIKEEKYTNAFEFGGFYIQKVYFSSIKKLFENDYELSHESIEKNIRLSGLSLDSQDYLKSIDETIIGKEGKIAKNNSQTVKPNYFYKDKFGEENIVERENSKNIYNLNMLINDAKTSVIQTINKIKNGEFPITPTYAKLDKSNTNLTCVNCPFLSVCYVNKKKDAKCYDQEIQEKFGEENETEDEEEENDDYGGF